MKTFSILRKCHIRPTHSTFLTKRFTHKFIHYDNPLVGRYASEEMSFIWSPQKKFSTWRKLWIALAQAQKELGLPITTKQIEEMKQHETDIDFELAREKEQELKHDVMAHIHTFGAVCPSAKPIIHLGATSAFVGDNTDIICMKESMQLVQKRLLKLMSLLRDFAKKYKDLPTLGYTHFQPAQLTTVGKRATLWLQDFLLDFKQLERMIEEIPLRGAKGTTGTQASFLELFNGDHEKVKKMEKRIVELLGFKSAIPVCGQTYTRKIDYQVLSILNGIAASANKMAVDIRLLMSLKEVDEPFESKQVGSSAMAYKRNPMRCERICALARYVISLTSNASQTHANQWFERTLDDSANRRLSIPESFLATDVILSIASNVMDGIHVWPHVIRKRIEAELPFMATENILMEAVKMGGDRQELHEIIRELSMQAAKRVKEEGKENDLLERIAKHPAFDKVQLKEITDPKLFIGRAPQQVDEFIEEEVDPVLKKYSDQIPKMASKLNV